MLLSSVSFVIVSSACKEFHKSSPLPSWLSRTKRKNVDFKAIKGNRTFLPVKLFNSI
jgi:hypothetical protein